MKKILFAFVLMFALAFGATAQTTVQVNDTNAGYIEQYPAISDIVVDSIVHDSLIVPDSIHLTWTTYTYDTVYVEGYYDFRAFANVGYYFSHWEVITTYNKWYDTDSLDNLIETDSIWNDTIIQYNIEMVDDSNFINYDGWLEWDMGIPDLSEVTIDDISSIVITAYFLQDDPVGIGQYNTPSFKVYPNPTTGTINVLGDIHWVTVFDQVGRVVTATDAPVINLQNYPGGVYFIRVTTTDNKTATVKVIKR